MSHEKYFPIYDWDIPRQGFFFIVAGCWWIVNDEGLPLFYQSREEELIPRYHRSREHAEAAAGDRPIRWFSIVYVPISPKEYHYYQRQKND